MGYSLPQITEVLSKTDKTLYKVGAIAYENMFSELSESLDYERDIIFVYKKAVEWADDFYVGDVRTDAIVERLSLKISIYDYGSLNPIYSGALSITNTLPGNYYLYQLGDVNITNLQNNQVLTYNSVLGMWVNSGGNTAVRSNQSFTATLNQTTFVTSAPFTTGLLDVYLNGVKLNSSNYSTFGEYSITLYDGCLADDIIDVIIYGTSTSILDLSSYVLKSTTITINGVTYDLSTNRTWTIDALPSQTGNSGKYLTTDGTVASWGTINLTGYVPYTGATGAVSLGLFGLTAGALTLQPQALNSSTYKITQQMASNDYWSIYGFASVADYGDLYFELQDNAAFADGQRFRFHYGNASSGTPKDILVMDYNSATIDGTLVVNKDATINELTIGKGLASLSNNSALGKRALFHTTTGNYNTAVGHEAGHNLTTGQYNTAIGQSAMFTATSAAQNVAIGVNSLLSTTSGGSNVVVGLDGMQHNTTGSSNTAIGYNAGSHITGGSTPNTTASNSVFIGRDSKAKLDGGTNEIVIGQNAVGNGSNTATIGNSSITANYFTGSINGGSFIKSGGTSAQILAADGSVITAGTNITISGGTISASGGGAGMAIGGAITSANAGSVLFAGTSGVLQQDNANFFWDDTNNRLGIGTTTPATPLHIIGGSGTIYDVNEEVSLQMKSSASKTSVFQMENTTSGKTVQIRVSTSGLLDFTLRTTGSAGGVTMYRTNGVKTFYEGQLLVGTSSGLNNIGLEMEHLSGVTYLTSFNRNTLTWLPMVVRGSYVELTATGTTVQKIFSTGNTVLQNGGTFTDAGYRLDVNGTARVSGDMVVNGLTVGKGTNSLLRNTALGVSALIGLNVGASFNDNTAIGYESMKTNTTGHSNTAIGSGALTLQTNAAHNTAIGAQSLTSLTTGSNNTAIGSQSLFKVTSGSNNIGIGYNANTNTTTASNNIGIGKETLFSTTSGADNVAIGRDSLRGNIVGNRNLAIGGLACLQSNTGNYNIGLGAYSLEVLNSGSNNISIGDGALNTTTTGSSNVAIGLDAGRRISGGGNNTITNQSIFIGQDTRPLAISQTNQIVIGYGETGLGSNTTIIGNSSTITTALRGRLLLGTTTDTGLYQLDVNGTARVSAGAVLLGGAGTYDYGLRVYNNAGTTEIFSVRNDQQVTVNGALNVATGKTIYTNGIGLPNTASALNISGSTTQGGIITFSNGGVNHSFTSGSVNIFTIGSPITYAPSSGTGVFNTFAISPVINQTGGANGITRGIYVNPTLTAAADWRSIEISNNSGWGIYQSGASANNYFAGNLLIGTPTVGTYKLDVVGDGRFTGNLTAISTTASVTSGMLGWSAVNGYVQTTIPASTSFSAIGYAFSSLIGNNYMTYQGSATFAANTFTGAVVGINNIAFTAASSTITITQSSSIRTYSAGLYQNTLSGSVNGTITHMSGLAVRPIFRASGTSTITVDNNYGLLIADQNEFSHATITNRWGIYQEGLSDNNYFSSKLLVGTTTDIASAKVIIDSTSQGVLVPRMTTTQINAITSPAEGLLVYNTTISHFCCYQLGAWVKFNHSPM